MAAGRTRRRAPLDWLAPALLLVTPFVILLRHADHPLLEPGAWVALLWLGGVGAALGAVASRLGWPVRVVVVAALVTLFVDVQTTWIDGFGVRALAVFAGVAVVGGLLHGPLSALVCVVTGTLLASSILLPVDRPSAGFEPGELPPLREDLPPIVYLILDEHIGVEGLPLDVDPDRRNADAIKRFYLDQGFDVYGAAYAISTNSVVSIANVLNLNVDPPLRSVYAVRPGDEKRFGVTTSRLFGDLAADGYRFRIHQSDYLDFCHLEPSVPIESCETYELETIRSIRDAPLGAIDKASVMLALYTRLSSLLDGARNAYQRTTLIQAKKGRSLPRWKTVGRVSSTSVTPVLETLADELADAKPGTVYFAHLMLPHYPYAYEADCGIRPDPEDWLAANDAAHFPSVNSPEGRRLRYDLYLPQVECARHRMADLFDAMRAAGTFDGARVVVHGDHGSRIQEKPMATKFEDRMAENDYLDAFSTLFAVKPPGATAPGRYRDDLVAVQQLAVLATGEDALPELPSGPPTVYLAARGTDHPEPRTMPAFAGGRIVGDAGAVDKPAAGALQKPAAGAVQRPAAGASKR